MEEPLNGIQNYQICKNFFKAFPYQKHFCGTTRLDFILRIIFPGCILNWGLLLKPFLPAAVFIFLQHRTYTFNFLPSHDYWNVPTPKIF